MTIGMSMTSVITTVGEVVTGVGTWAGSIVTVFTSNPILFLPLGISLALGLFAVVRGLIKK